MIRLTHSFLSSAMHCRPATGHRAIAALFAREWGSEWGYQFGGYLLISNPASGSKSTERRGVFTGIFIAIQVAIQNLLISDPDCQSGKYRHHPVLT